MDFQQQALELDEAFALLDGFDFAASVCSTTSPSSYSSDSPSISGHESLADSDEALLSLLTDASPCEIFHSRSPRTVRDAELPTRPETQPKQPQLKKKKTPPRKAAPTAVVLKRPRKKTRLEIIQLREELEQLQLRHSSLQVAQKQHRSASTATQYALHACILQRELATAPATQHESGSTIVGNGAPRSLWLEHAVQQHKQLQQSKALNQKLRDAVAQQLKVTNSMQALFQKKVPRQEVELLLQVPAASTEAQQLPSSREQLLRLVHASIDSQYGEIDSVCNRIRLLGDTKFPFSVGQTKQDAVRGLTFEFTTNTLVANDFHTVGRLMWDRIVNSKGPMCSSDEVKHSQVYEKHVEMTIPSRFGELHLDGAMVICKFKEEHRVVLIIASTNTVSDTSIMAYQQAWMVVSKATSSERVDRRSIGAERGPTTLFQTFSSVYSEKFESTSPLDAPAHVNEQTDLMSKIVVETLGDHMQQHMAELQSALQSKAENLVASLSEFKCPLSGCPC